VKVTALKAKHEQELAAASQQCQEQQEVAEEKNEIESLHKVEEEQQKQQLPQSGTTSSIVSKKQEKARQKRAKQRQAELERHNRIAQETANAGPSRRDVELEQLQQQICSSAHAHYTIAEIPADGHCLYRAVAAQLNINNTHNTSQEDYRSVRGICADRLLQHADEYAPFAELDDEDGSNNFANYCERVRSGTEWGGHLEIRALATALQRPIHIYSVAAAAAVNGYTVVEPEEDQAQQLYCNNDNNNAEREPIRLSYHVHYYALGEHYNQVVPK
jgi:OTU domain-containing protein 6